MPDTPTPASLVLADLARRVLAPYIALPQTRAALLAGSVAEGLSDEFSDLDMTVYYDTLPTDSQLAGARERSGGEALWSIDNREDGGLIESFRVDGVECQIGHATIGAWEQNIAAVLEQLEVDSPLQKALDGTLHGVPLHGAPLIRAWQSRIRAYPDALAEAMVKHYFKFFPIWSMATRFITRDATIWRYQVLVEASQHLLGTLAGLNRCYFTTFQFKRMHRFCAQLRLAPPDLAGRIERLFALEPFDSLAALEELVGETADLLAEHMPQVEINRARLRLGQREQSWGARLGLEQRRGDHTHR
jgi:hypothetical protein